MRHHCTALPIIPQHQPKYFTALPLLLFYRRKVSEMKNEAKWHIQSLQAVFEDRVRLLKEQAVKSDDSVIKAQRQMGSEVRVGVIHCITLHCMSLPFPPLFLTFKRS
jgi:hypothetical protein